MGEKNDKDFGLPDLDGVDSGRGGRSLVYVFVLVLFLGSLGFGYWWFFLRGGDVEPVVDEVDMVGVDEGVVTDKDVGVEEVSASVDEEVVRVDEGVSSVEGSINIVKSAGGFYYVVLNSFIDADLALDYAKGLKKGGSTVYIVEPDGSRHMGYFYVCVCRCKDFEVVRGELNSLVESYGRSDLWYLRY